MAERCAERENESSGFVCFEMQRRGANAVGFDLAEHFTYDAPPHSAEYLQPDVYRDGLRRIRNAWWLAHAASRLKARVAYEHANHLPATLRRFDIKVLADIMQYFKNPISVMMGLAEMCDEAVVATETDWMHDTDTISWA